MSLKFEPSKGMEQGDEYSNAKASKRKAAICSLFEQVHAPGSAKATHCYSAVKADVGFVGGYIFDTGSSITIKKIGFQHNLFFSVGNFGHPKLGTILLDMSHLHICICLLYFFQEVGRSALRYVHVLVTPFLVFFFKL